MPSLTHALALLAFGLAPTSGYSQDMGPFTTVEMLEQQLMLDKSRRIPAFNKVQTALNNREYKKAIDAAKGLQSHPEYNDYHHYLLGQAELGRMRSFIVTGKSATAVLAGEQAIFHFVQTQGSNPYTTLQRRATAQMGEVELLLADIQLRLKKRTKALQLYENGFQRLAQVNLMAMVPKASIISYALLCDKHKTDMCTSWVVKLAPLVAKSEASRVIDRITAFKRPYIEKTAPVPYKVDVDLQAFQKGFGTYLEGKYEDAYGTWRDLLRDYPRTTIKLRTKFWMGRAAQRSDHHAQAETLYREIIRELPFSYYALLSSWFGNIELSRMMDAELPQATSETSLLTPTDVMHIRRAETLIASGVPDLAQIELQDLRPNLNMPNEFLVYLAALNHLAGSHLNTFQVLGELSTRSFRGLFSSYGQKLYFPTSRLPLIRDIAKEWKIDPMLVISVVKQESAFNPEAVSGASAYGLMQIIPPTARDLNPRIDVIDLLNPTQNVKLGVKYLNHLLSRYKGNIVPTLAAYNAGPGHADRWQREIPNGLPTEENIELIGFRETREYVQNILRNFYWYNRRLKGESFASLNALTAVFAPVREPLRDQIKQVKITETSTLPVDQSTKQ